MEPLCARTLPRTTLAFTSTSISQSTLTAAEPSALLQPCESAAVPASTLSTMEGLTPMVAVARPSTVMDMAGFTHTVPVAEPPAR